MHRVTLSNKVDFKTFGSTIAREFHFVYNFVFQSVNGVTEIARLFISTEAIILYIVSWETVLFKQFSFHGTLTVIENISKLLFFYKHTMKNCSAIRCHHDFIDIPTFVIATKTLKTKT